MWHPTQGGAVSVSQATLLMSASLIAGATAEVGGGLAAPVAGVIDVTGTTFLYVWGPGPSCQVTRRNRVASCLAPAPSSAHRRQPMPGDVAWQCLGRRRSNWRGPGVRVCH